MKPLFDKPRLFRFAKRDSMVAESFLVGTGVDGQFCSWSNESERCHTTPLLMCTVLYSYSEEHQKSPEYHAPIKVYDSSPLLLIESVPLIAFSFQCHVTCALVYRSLKSKPCVAVQRPAPVAAPPSLRLY